MRLSVESVLLWIFANSILHMVNSFVVGPVKVEFKGRRIKRSTSTTLVTHKFDVKVTAFVETHELKLQPLGPIFGPNFQSNEVDVDENGQPVWTEQTPSSQGLSSIEESIYVDVDRNTAVRLEVVDGQINLNGVVNGARIRKRQDNRDHEMGKAETPLGTPASDPMFSVPKQERTRRSTTDDGPLRLEPELSFVIEYELGKVFNFDRDAILEYVAITVNDVNSRYAITNNATFFIEFKFVGLHIIKSPAAQPFISTGKNVEGGKMLDNFAKWAFKNTDLGKYDLCVLMLGIEKDTFTGYQTEGLGKKGGACDLKAPGDVSNAVLYVRDTRGLFYGSFRLAYQLAISIGAVDEKSNSPCSGYSDYPKQEGYLMGQINQRGDKQFRFSPCSLALFSSFASCLSEISGAPSIHTSAQLPGDKVNSDAVCKFLRGPDAKGYFVKQDPDEQCREFVCINKKDEAAISIMFVMGNGFSCGNRGKCKNGWCRNQAAPLALNQLCAVTFGIRLAVYQLYSDHDVCYGIKCARNQDSTGSIGLLFPLPGTPCGQDMICVNEKCTLRSKVQPAEECMVKTGKKEATVGKENKMSTNGCKSGVKCHYGTEFEYLIEPNHGESYKNDASDMKGGIFG